MEDGVSRHRAAAGDKGGHGGPGGCERLPASLEVGCFVGSGRELAVPSQGTCFLELWGGEAFHSLTVVEGEKMFLSLVSPQMRCAARWALAAALTSPVGTGQGRVCGVLT